LLPETEARFVGQNAVGSAYANEVPYVNPRPFHSINARLPIPLSFRGLNNFACIMTNVATSSSQFYVLKAQ
jgi:hypothetical protein